MISKSDIAKLKKSDAITHLTKLNLSTSGGRPELLKRLREHYHNNKEKTKTSKSIAKNESECHLRNGNNIPSKSKIQLMKKDKLIELCNELKISNDGNKSDLVSRVEEFYRPTQDGNIDVDISNGVPTKTDLRKMGKKDLAARLSDNNLLTTGSRLELYKRLEEFYRPTEKTEKVDEGLVDSLSLECEDESVSENNSSNTDTTLQIIEYNDYKIGICEDTGCIHEQDESDGEWYKTNLVWDYTNACPTGYSNLTK
uniref:SAP domain-containing protein n=1 Tax=viral metagenome TaxID=1070528 RepID=A0A6C0AG17_9ZZZZ|tara:strand:- start:36899 stop:37663 length:765 start_codon:yes stop_codon:yes gene_type:complete